MNVQRPLERGVLSRPAFRPRFLEGDDAHRRLRAPKAATGVLGLVDGGRWDAPAPRRAHAGTEAAR